MPVLKVWSRDRNTKKIIMAATVNEALEKGMKYGTMKLTGKKLIIFFVLTLVILNQECVFYMHCFLCFIFNCMYCFLYFIFNPPMYQSPTKQS